MKNKKTLKQLVDLLYILTIIILVVITLIVIPLFFILDEKDFNLMIKNTSAFHWSFLFIGYPIFIFFLRALYYLKKVSKHLLLNKYFTAEISIDLKKSGRSFIYSGIAYFSAILFFWLINIFISKNLSIGIDFQVILPLFLIIIGLLFLIQSTILKEAKEFKEENELTV